MPSPISNALLLLLSPLAALAAPTANPLAPRSCPGVFPLGTTRINLINRPDLGTTTTQTLHFTLPHPATSLPGPCTLRARFPPRWEVTDTGLSSVPPNPLAVNVYALDGPAPGALVGTSKFGSEQQPSTTEERIVVINSFACRDEMEFRFELAGVGEVGFVEGWDAGLGVAGGVEVVWGC